MKLLASIFCLCLTPATYGSELVRTCDIGNHTSRRIEVVRNSKIASTHIYYLRQGGKLSPLFGSPDQSRGSSVLAECVGKKTRALVVSGEFTANALQGFVITLAPGSNKLERLDFAEKSRPQWLYLAAHKIIVAIPTSGLGETNAKYVAYHHDAAQASPDQVDTVDQLPSQNGFEVVKLKIPSD